MVDVDLDDDDDDDQPETGKSVKPRSKKPLLLYLLVSSVVIAILATVYYFATLKKEELPDDQRPITVLIVGNDTLHTNDVPNMLREVATMSKSWRPLDVTCLAVEDYSLGQHIEKNDVQHLIEETDWDFVVLQDRWLQPLQDPAGMLEATKTLSKLARKKGSHVVLFVPWADRNEDKRQEVLSTVSRKLAERLSIDIAPAGDVFFSVSKKHKELNPYVADNHHVSPIGAWLAAATLYSVLTNQKPKLKSQEFTYHSGNGDEPHVPIKGDVATDIETMVWEKVNEENKGRRLGPPVFKKPQSELEFQ